MITNGSHVLCVCVWSGWWCDCVVKSESDDYKRIAYVVCVCLCDPVMRRWCCKILEWWLQTDAYQCSEQKKLPNFAPTTLRMSWHTWVLKFRPSFTHALKSFPSSCNIGLNLSTHVCQLRRKVVGAKFMLPKRRFWKDEQKTKWWVSIGFSKIRSPNQVLIFVHLSKLRNFFVHHTDAYVVCVYVCVCAIRYGCDDVVKSWSDDYKRIAYVVCVCVLSGDDATML